MPARTGPKQLVRPFPLKITFCFFGPGTPGSPTLSSLNGPRPLLYENRFFPVCWNETPLPPSLTTYQGIPFTDFEKSLGKLLNSLEKSIPESDIQHNQEVISNLEKITPGKPEEVIEAAKHIFKQHGWTVLGDFYQAARDINITVQKSEPDSSRNFFEKWQFRVAFLAAALTAVSLLIDYLEKSVCSMREMKKCKLLNPCPGQFWTRGAAIH